jgi:heme-degrading monooxygenase HmoA
MIAPTPAPPYYAVIFTSIRTAVEEGYIETAKRMVELAEQQPGYLGLESARNELGITISYWTNLESIKAWKAQAEHQIAQEKGKKDWYTAYKTRICLVERDYAHP